jgi:hypothetical protein
MLATGRQRSSLALVLVAATALTVWFSNQILPHVRDETQGWNQAYLFPRMNPVGAAFRAGTRLSARFCFCRINWLTLDGLTPFTCS